MKCPVCDIELRTAERTEQEDGALFRLQCMNKKCSAFGSSLLMQSREITKAEQEEREGS